VKQLGWLLWKDTLTEARSLERLGTLVLFSIVTLVTLSFALPPSSSARPLVAAGFIWIAIVFASVLEFRRSFEAERKDGTLDGLRASPIDSTLLFVSKALSTFAIVAIVTAALVPLTRLFFGGRTAGIGAAIGIALLGATGLIAWGTLFGAVVGSSRAADVVLPILLFPLVVPQTIAVARLLECYLGGVTIGNISTGWILLLAFDGLAWGSSVLLFEYVLDE
jgi:heme exporter protein B